MLIKKEFKAKLKCRKLLIESVGRVEILFSYKLSFSILGKFYILVNYLMRFRFKTTEVRLFSLMGGVNEWM